MVEWSITPVLKTGVLRGTGGSNPSLSAISLDYQWFTRFTPNFTPQNVKLGVFFIISIMRKFEQMTHNILLGNDESQNCKTAALALIIVFPLTFPFIHLPFFSCLSMPAPFLEA